MPLEPPTPEHARVWDESILQVMRDNGCSTLEELRDKIFEQLRIAHAPNQQAQHDQNAQPIEPAPYEPAPPEPVQPIQPTQSIAPTEPKRKIFILSSKLSTTPESIIAVYSTTQHANFTALRYAARSFSIHKSEILDFVPGFPAPSKQYVIRTSWKNGITEIKRGEEFVEVYPKYVGGEGRDEEVVIEGKKFRIDEDPVEEVELVDIS